MPKKAREMTPAEVAALPIGVHRVGNPAGLTLIVRPGGRSWSLRYSAPNGKRREVGLGSAADVPLQRARDKAREIRASLRLERVDPIDLRRQAEAQAKAAALRQRTFAEAAADYIKDHTPGWKNAKHAQQWTNTLGTYAEPVIGSLPVGDVTQAHVLLILRPIWTTKPETASRLRQRIALVLDYSRAHGWRSGDNPAEWRGNLQAALPAISKVKVVEHHAAMPYAEMPQFMQRLAEHSGIGARCLEFVVYAACRSGEARGATWAEVEGDAWTVPASRMKGGRAHTVPLPRQALALLLALPRSGPLLFPGQRGAALSDAALGALLRRMGLPYTPHGFRSSFSTWAAEQTNASAETREACLAHVSGDRVAAAYQRSDFAEKRRTLMQAWADYIAPG